MPTRPAPVPAPVAAPPAGAGARRNNNSRSGSASPTPTPQGCVPTPHTSPPPLRRRMHGHGGAQNKRRGGSQGRPRLVGAGSEVLGGDGERVIVDALRVGEVADAAADGERHEHALARAPQHLQHRRVRQRQVAVALQQAGAALRLSLCFFSRGASGCASRGPPLGQRGVRGYRGAAAALPQGPTTGHTHRPLRAASRRRKCSSWRSPGGVKGVQNAGGDAGGGGRAVMFRKVTSSAPSLA